MNRDDGDARINPTVFYGSAVGLLVISLWTIIYTDAAAAVIDTALTWIAASFGWLYYLSVVAYLLFVVFLGLSRYGKIRLGPDHSRPEFPLLSWAAMLFAAGIGIDLLFFCVSEPVTQWLQPPEGEGGTARAAREAMAWTFLHWGISGWGIYTLVGLSLAYFSYRQGMPLIFRSALYPIFGRRIYGALGHSVDIAAVLGTIFGIATSLGIGMIQLNFGLNYMFGVPEGLVTQASLAVVIVIFAAISAVSGVEKGIRRLSEFNMGLALVLLAFILLTGQTLFLLNAFVMNVGDYVSNFVQLSFDTFAYDQPTEWLNAWTLFFWAWWIAWAPFVGMFLARISRGRTIAQFVAGTLTIPLVFMMLWMSIMGNSAIELLMRGAADFGQQAVDNPGSSIYMFLENMPWAVVTTVAATILAIVFFVTSGDSGSLVLSNLTSIIKDPNQDAPSWMRIVWAAIIGLLTVGLLMADGLTALQSAVVIMGLPFTFVLFFMMGGIYKALRLEALKEVSDKAAMPGYLSGRTDSGRRPGDWMRRLARVMSFPDRRDVERMMREVVRPAMEEIERGLAEQNVEVAIEEGEPGNEHLTLKVVLPDSQNFTYQVRPSRHNVPAYAMRAHGPTAVYYRLEVHLREGGQNYDLTGYSKPQVIEDILDQYERHLGFLHAQSGSSGAADTELPEHNP